MWSGSKSPAPAPHRYLQDVPAAEAAPGQHVVARPPTVTCRTFQLPKRPLGSMLLPGSCEPTVVCSSLYRTEADSLKAASAADPWAKTLISLVTLT